MNKIFASILFVLISLTGFSQTVSEPYKLWPKSNFRPPQDTTIAPERLGELRYKASDGNYYKCISLTGLRWEVFGVGVGGGDVSGTGTTGYLPKWTGASTLGSSIIYEGSGTIMIGTTTPGYLLEVNGVMRGVDEIRLRNPSLSNQAPVIAFADDNIVVLDKQGFSARTGSHLAIAGDNSITGGNYINGRLFKRAGTSVVNTPFSVVGIGRPDSYPFNYLADIASIGAVFDQGTWTSGVGLTFNTSIGGDISGGAGIAERMRIHSDGNVSINSTTNSGYKLDVNGNVRANSGYYVTEQDSTATPGGGLIYREGSTGKYKITGGGLVTTGAQTWDGVKTFTSSPRIPDASHVFATNLSVLGGDGTNHAVAKLNKGVLSQVLNEVVTKSATYTVGTNDEMTHLVDATSAAVTINIPPAATVGAGWSRTFIKVDGGSNTVTLDCDGSELINSSGTYALASQWKYVKIVSTGSNYVVTGNN
jgi:hypothetical protein